MRGACSLELLLSDLPDAIIHVLCHEYGHFVYWVGHVRAASLCLLLRFMDLGLSLHTHTHFLCRWQWDPTLGHAQHGVYGRAGGWGVKEVNTLQASKHKDIIRSMAAHALRAFADGKRGR